MKMFGRKAAGREDSRPALEFRRARFAAGAVGDVPMSYEGQMRALYLRNAIAQRAVRMIADAVGDAPISAAPEVLALVQARSAGQALTATVAGHLLLHGNAYVQMLSDGPRPSPGWSTIGNNFEDFWARAAVSSGRFAVGECT